jgi:hypothetical protein
MSVLVGLAAEEIKSASSVGGLLGPPTRIPTRIYTTRWDWTASMVDPIAGMRLILRTGRNRPPHGGMAGNALQNRCIANCWLA